MDSQITFDWFPMWLAIALRVFTIVALPYVVVHCAVYWKTCTDYGQRLRFLALELFAMSVAYTETYRLTSVVTPRLFLNVAATACALVGLRAMARNRGGRDGRQAE